MIEISRSGKRRCRFCDGDECRYTLNKLQRLSSLQVIPVHLEKSNDSESEDNVSVYCPEKEHYNEEDSNEDKTIDDLLNLKRLNSGNVPQQQYSSVEDCNGENARHPELPGSGKYFQEMIHNHTRQTLQRQINELKSRDTARVSFDSAMKYPITLVEDKFKCLKLDVRPVEVIPYPGDNTFKVLTDALVEFDPDFYLNIRSKSHISKMPLIV